MEKKGSFSSKKERREGGREGGRKEGRKERRKEGRKKCLSGLCFGEHILRGGETVIYKLRCFV